MEKGLSGRPKGRAHSQTALLLFIELEAVEPIVVSNRAGANMFVD
jgi:hypothetical protein